MTWHWRKSKACDLDELLDDLNPAMKDLEGEMQGVGDNVETFILSLKPTTQPTADATEALLYLDEADGYVEIVLPVSWGGGRGRVAIDWDPGSFPPGEPQIYYAVAADVGALSSLGDEVGMSAAYVEARAGASAAVPGNTYLHPYAAFNDGGASWTVTLIRGIVRFDTSSLVSTPVSAIARFTSPSEADWGAIIPDNLDPSGGPGFLTTQDLYLVLWPRAAPEAAISAIADWAAISPMTLASADHPNVETLTNDGQIEFALNAAGLAAIAAGTYTCFALVTALDRANSSSGMVDDNYVDFPFYSPSHSGDADYVSPELEVTV